MTLPKASGAKNAVLNAPIAPEEMPITTRCEGSSLHVTRHVQRRVSHLELAEGAGQAGAGRGARDVWREAPNDGQDVLEQEAAVGLGHGVVLQRALRVINNVPCPVSPH